MKEYISGRYLNTQPSLMLKVFENATKYDDIINLSIGEPDMHTHKSIVDACFRAGLEGNTHYIDIQGDMSLREGIAKRYNSKFNSRYDGGSVFISDGAIHGLYMLFKAVINPKDEIIVFSPFFTAYKMQIEEFDGIAKVVPTLGRDNFEIDIDRLKGAISKNTRAILLNSPNNPTGTVYSKDTIDKIIDIAVENDILVIMDDVYETMIYEGDYYSPCMREDAKDRVIIVGSFSKAFAMTGWRVGYVIAPYKLMKAMRTINANIVYCSNSMAQKAALYALNEGSYIVEDIKNTFNKRVKLCYEEVSKIGSIKCQMPKASFYLFPDITGTGYSSMEFIDYILHEAHVLLLPGNAFGDSGEGYARIACTLNDDLLTEGIRRIKDAVSKIS